MATPNMQDTASWQAMHAAGIANEPHTFRRAMRQLAGGVSVITASQGAQRTGLTATSVISLSLDPAELLISVNRNASACPLIVETGRFGVNVLDANLHNVAERFSGKDGLRGEQRYQEALWERDEYGVWLLSDAPATFSCKVEKLWEHRSHILIVGTVVRTNLGASAIEPLTYWQGAYGGFTTLPHLKLRKTLSTEKPEWV